MVAVTSLPVPLSPVTSTVLSLLPMTLRNSNTARMRALRPTTTESMEICCGSMAHLHETQRLELRDFLADCRLDADVQGHMRAGTAGAHAGQANVRRIPDDGEQFDVAAIRLQEGANPVEYPLDAFPRNHWNLLVPTRRVC